MLSLLALALLSPPPAAAGCATDPDRLLRWALAPLIAEGTVTSVEVIDGEVFERVTVEHVHKGAVTGAELRLRGELPRSGCPGARLFPVGAAVYVVGSLDEDGAVDISPCTADVGLRAALADDLAALAATPGGRTFAGAPAPAAAPRAALGGPPGDHVRFGDAHLEGQILGDGSAEPLTISVGVGALDVAVSAAESDLAAVASTDWSVAGSGLHVRAGTLIDAEGYAILSRGWAVPRFLPASAIGDRWQPAATPERPAEEGGGALPGGSWRLRDGPEGQVIATLRQEQPLGVWVTGSRGDWRELWVDTPELYGTVWIEAAALGSGRGGVAGGYFGMPSGAPIEIEVPRGAEVRRPGGGDVFARAREATSLQWLVTGDGEALVVVEGPAGPEVGSVRCVADEAAAVGCRVLRD